MTTVLISGASGFIGGHAAAHLAMLGWTVIGTGRQPTSPACCTDYYVRPFGSSWSEILQQHTIDAVIHCAYDSSPQHSEAAEQGTTQWIDEAHRAGVARQIFLSSISARASSRSAYGQTKHRLERQVIAMDGLVLRPGLVIGPGGLFARMVRVVQNLPVIPMIAGGRNHVYFTGIDALCHIIGDFLQNERDSRAWNVQQPEPTTMRALIKTIGAELGVRRLLMPIPYGLCLCAAKAVPAGILARTGVTYENVVGLKENDVPNLPSDYAMLGGQTEELQWLVARTIHGRPTPPARRHTPAIRSTQEATCVGNNDTA